MLAFAMIYGNLPRVSWEANNADGAASEPNEAVDVAGADAEEAEDGGGSGRGGLSVNGRVSIWG